MTRPLPFTICLLCGFLIAALATTTETARGQDAARPPRETVAEDGDGEADGAAGEDPVNTTIVIGRRKEDEIFEVPSTVESLSGSFLTRRRAYRTLPEALAEVPGVLVQKTGRGQGSPYIRGFTGFRTLLLVDGIRLNHAAMRSGPNQYWGTVDPLTLDRVEIFKGPASVLYGSDAIGGTVNALTRSPTVLDSAYYRSEDGSRLYHRYSSAERSLTSRYEVHGALTKYSAVLLGLTAHNELGPQGILFYLVAYALMTIGTFTVVQIVGRRNEHNICLLEQAFHRDDIWVLDVRICHEHTCGLQQSMCPCS